MSRFSLTAHENELITCWESGPAPERARQEPMQGLQEPLHQGFRRPREQQAQPVPQVRRQQRARAGCHRQQDVHG